MTGYKNFIEVCESSCTRHGPKLAYRYIHNKSGDEESLSFAELRENAIALASAPYSSRRYSGADKTCRSLM